MHPVGPEPPAVYWRRRLLVGLAILVALIIVVVMLWPGGGSDSKPLTLGTPSASPTASVSPSTSPSVSGSPSPTAGAECPDDAIKVTAEIAKQTNPVGSPIQFTMLIANTSTETCSRNVGPRVNTMVVTSGGYHAWSSDDCNPGGGDQIVSIPPNGAYKVTATWNQVLTQPGCPSGQGKAQAGSYSVVARNGSVESAPLTFAIS